MGSEGFSLFCFFFFFLRFFCFSLFFFVFLRFSSYFFVFLFFYSLRARASNCNLLGKWGISLWLRVHTPRSELPDREAKKEWKRRKKGRRQNKERKWRALATPFVKSRFLIARLSFSVWSWSKLGKGKWRRKKTTGVSQNVKETSKDESQCIPSLKNISNKRFGDPNFWGISPKLFAALRGIHPYLCTPVLPRGQAKKTPFGNHCGLPRIGLVLAGAHKVSSLGPPISRTQAATKQISSLK